MIYWKIQMYQPHGRGEFNIDSTEMLRQKQPIIGTGDWDDIQCKYFTGEHPNGVKIGDVILVHEGKKPIALCQIISDSYKDEALTEKFFNKFFRHVRILLWLNMLPHDVPQHQKTLERLINSKTETWKYIHDFYLKSVKEHQLMENQKLLNFKKQIILQGPPGTGKTRLAKELASTMCGVDVTFIKKTLKVGDKIDNVSGAINYYTISEIGATTLSLKSERTTQDWKPTYTEIINKYNRLIRGEEVKSKNGLNPYDLAVAKHMLKLTNQLDNPEQVKIIQFHPSFAYEDFVRGIVTKTGEKGISYEAQNKVLADFAKKALDNYRLSKEDNEEAKIDKWVENSFEEYKFDIEQRVEEKILPLSGSIGIFEVQNDCFKYGIDWQVPSRINFKDFKLLIKAVVNGSHLLNNAISKDLSVHAHYRNTYYSSLLIDFFNKFTFESTSAKVEEKNFVLIIDEINRANLSTVLGELIYALEYRGEAVDTLYDVEGSSKLILPPNLFIIGTMNTADRSVAQIDYAIRRRFAFVNILPEDLTAKIGADFKYDLFKKVSELFVKEYDSTIDYSKTKQIERSIYLSEEFDPKEVWLGHSYFIQQYELDENSEQGDSIDFVLRLDYEIKPILREYVKDGILKTTALAYIEDLACSE